MSNLNRSTEPVTLGPAMLARLRRERRDDLRLDKAWRQVTSFVPGDQAEEHIKLFLISLLSSVEEWCDPGEAGDADAFEAARESLEYYHWLFTFPRKETNGTLETSGLPLELLAALVVEDH